MQKTKVFLLIQPAALEVGSFWRTDGLTPSCSSPRAGAHVLFLKATEQAHCPSLTWQFNTRGSHILAEHGIAAQTIFLEVISYLNCQTCPSQNVARCPSKLL